MEVKTIKELKKGEFFKRKEDSKRVYIRGDYIRSERRYECQAFDDINQFITLKPDTKVFIGFTF